jgi:hypothetical protein
MESLDFLLKNGQCMDENQKEIVNLTLSHSGSASQPNIKNQGCC